LAGAAEAAGEFAVAVGRWVRLTGNGMDAVLVPHEGFQPYIVSTGDGWPEWVWITMDSFGNVATSDEVLLPDDGRGYRLSYVDGKYHAGCRTFDYTEAVAHWSNPDHEDPVSAGLLLQEVERHHNRNGEGK